MHTGPECGNAFLPKNSFCCGVMHLVKKLVFDDFCFLQEVANSKADGISCELNHWVVAFEVRKIVLNLVQQPVEVDDDIALENVTDATSSFPDLCQRWKSLRRVSNLPRHNSSFETKAFTLSQCPIVLESAPCSLWLSSFR